MFYFQFYKILQKKTKEILGEWLVNTDTITSASSFILLVECLRSRLTIVYLQLQLCLMVLVENSELGSLCGIPYLSASASCLVHVLNRDRFLPEREDELFTWAVYAEVESSIFPPKTEELCRYGEPFRGGDIPIVRYEAAIGSEPGLSDIYPFEEVFEFLIYKIRSEF